MEIASIFSETFSILLALVFTALCCSFAVVSVRLKSKSVDSDGGGKTFPKHPCDCICSCVVDDATNTEIRTTASNNPDSNGGLMPGKLQMGASMMEQLVPEITNHALSYLDYPSLCRLSMTNSLMRKVANDDDAWKSLYQKDFTLEQHNVIPDNGWKAYYAVTKALLNVNAEFFNIIRDRSLEAMDNLWLNADYVKCVHASGESFSGYEAVMRSWQFAFNWDQVVVDFQVQDPCIRVVTGMAWITMKAFVEEEGAGPYNVTNIFEFSNGQWHMVHHHCSPYILQGLE
ncbi:F-box protein SKIP8-like [Impatiens glandulifera]|uniref:F-box protein SKIP8-like n=1 Tax=Impatiens glandulifera TaxID=253017 RepID=UPI001FB1849A|nr:F-box protein SKIP8-like [Impatiens glandulifera]